MEMLKLENQLCFPLYAASKHIIKLYTPLLKKIDLTYTQYLCMLVLWQHQSLKVNELGSYLFLDSGTLTPVLKKLEEKGLVIRSRSSEDERIINISLTTMGQDLQTKAVGIPKELASFINLSPEKAQSLYEILYEILNHE